MAMDMALSPRKKPIVGVQGVFEMLTGLLLADAALKASVSDRSPVSCSSHFKPGDQHLNNFGS